MNKKIIIIMALLTICLLAFTGCSAPITNSERPILTTELNSYALLEDFVTKHPDRTPGDPNTYNPNTGMNNADRAAKYISEKFVGLGYTAENDGMVKFTYENPLANNRADTAYNVVFRKDNPTSDEQIIIGAHYDNVTNMTLDNSKPIGGQGAYNNAVGVVGLLQTAKMLASVNLPFDVTFVAFGAENIDMAGSRNFVSKMTAEELNNTLLMINYSSIAGGDYIYMYADEVPTKHYDYFYDKAVDNKYNITNIPKNIRPVMNAQLKGSDMMYYNAAMLSDIYPFMLQGVNTINYMSMNFADKSSQSVVEVAGKDNIDYTSADTLASMVDRMGGGDKGIARISSDIDTVVMSTVNTISGENFAQVMKDSRASKMDYSVFASYKIMQGIGFGVLGLFLVVLIVMYALIKSKVSPHGVVINTAYGRVDMTRGIVIPPQGESAPKEVIDPFGDDDTLTTKSDKKDKDDDTKGGEDTSTDTSKAKDVDDIFDI